MLENPSRRIYLDDDLRYELRSAAKDLWTCETRVTDDDYDKVPLRKDEQKALAPLFGRGFSVAGTGLGRVVLRFPDDWPLHQYVVKLGRHGNDPLSMGMQQNRAEIHLWNAIGERKPLLPVADFDPYPHRWVLMPHGTPLEEDEQDEIQPAVDALESLPFLTDQEFAPVNFVRWNDGVYFADYGRLDYEALMRCATIERQA